jgi:hypothetical protein
MASAPAPVGTRRERRGRRRLRDERADEDEGRLGRVAPRRARAHAMEVRKAGDAAE